MSSRVNDELMLRTHEAIERTLGTVREKELIHARQNGDLDELERLVSEVEAKMSQEHFFNYDILERGDEY